MADYTGTFNGSFTGSFTGDLVGVDYYDLENSPPTITPHQANQITANSNFRENFKANLNAQGLISSSAQIDYGSISNIPSGIVSSSQQIKDYLPSGVVSSSQQTKDYLPSGVVSSSQQTKDYLPSGTISSSVQVDYGSVSNIPSGIVSSSAQIISNLEGQSLSVATLTAETYIVSSSVTHMTTLFSSGSTMFGDDINDTHQFTGSMFVSGSFINNGLTYPLVDGDEGDILTTDGAGNLTFDRTRIYAQVKNISGTTLQKGMPVHVTSSVGNLDEVIAASASDASTMPATFVLAQTLNDDEEGLGILTGFINGVNTSDFKEGDVVYVAANGGYTNIKPTGSNLIQNLGIVTKVGTNGSGFIYGSGRANDVPNITSGYTWVGNADGVATPTPTSSFSSGSFSGSFEGDGSGLTNVPASGVVGLNLTRISTTNVTASVSEGTDTFKITSGSTTQFAIKSGSGNISASGDLSIKGFPSVSESLSSAGKITYDTASGDTFDLTNIQVNDYDDNVAINFLNGKLTLTFGSPTEPSSLNASLSGFAVDRFNKVQDEYDVNGSWNNGGYTLISASLYEGSTLLEEVGTGTSLSFNTTTSGSHTYRLEYTASSPLDGTLFKSSDTIIGTLSKDSPTAPSITREYDVQLISGNNIEEGATGSIAFTTSSGQLNGWEYTGGSTSPSTSPVTVSATGNVTIQASANYQSPTGQNDPLLTRTEISSVTSNRIRSLRYGVSTAISFLESEIRDIDEWVNNIGTIDVGTINPNNEQFTITTSGEYIYIIYDKNQSDLTGILNVNNSNSNDINVFTKTVVGNYKVYRSSNLSSTTILYKLTT